MLIDIQVWCRKCLQIDTIERLNVPTWAAARDPIAARAVSPVVITGPGKLIEVGGKSEAKSEAKSKPWACPSCGCEAGMHQYVRALDAEDLTPKERMRLKESQYHQCFKVTSDSKFLPPAVFEIALKNPETKAEL